MPYKREIELPFLDPRFVPEHPANHIPEDIRTEDQKKWLVDLTPAQENRRRKEWLREAMEEWTPPHVTRSWEVSEEIAENYVKAKELILPNKPKNPFEDLMLENPHDSTWSRILSEQLYDPAKDPDQLDFRKYMNHHFHIAYHRFHASHGDPNVPSEESSGGGR